jgi:hypothetical protein
MIPRILYPGMLFDDFLMVIDPPEAPIEPESRPVEDNASKSEESEKK